MMIRHRIALDQIRSNPDMRESDRYDWLLAVVDPGPDLLAASLSEADRRHKA